MSRSIRLELLAMGCAVTLTVASPTAAQERPRVRPEFTRQSLLIVNFTPLAGADVKLARRAGDEMRARLARLLDKREADVIRGFAIDRAMAGANMNPDSTFSPTAFHMMGSFFRADEYLQAYIANEGGQLRLSGDLVLTRDEQLRQPLPVARAGSLDSAVTLFAQGLLAARVQLPAQRRCENALAEGRAARAEAAARPAVTAYPRSTLARTCLVWSLRELPAPATDVLAVAREILALDPRNAHAIEAAARSFDALAERDSAATMWLRYAKSDTGSVDLALKVARALNDGRNSQHVEAYLAPFAVDFPRELRLTQQVWRAAFENKHWAAALSAGERLMDADQQARADSTFHLRLGIVYREVGRQIRAVELLAHAVSAFPKDERLYGLYAQLVRSEADSVIPRGMTLFPRNADLVAMSARELRTGGKLAESLAATQRAIALDSTIPRAHLVAAQLEIELGRPDSALLSLHRAVRIDRDSAAIAQFALARGNTLYQAATSTQSADDYRLAYRFLSFSDTVHPTTQARFLGGAAALGVARSSLNDATQISDKTESCRLVRDGASMLPAARGGLNAGVVVYGDMARQSLGYLDQLEPYVEERLKAYCGNAPVRVSVERVAR